MVSLTLCKLYNFKGKYCPNGTYNVIWRTSSIVIRNYCKNGKKNQRPKKALEPPEEPTTCCMSGCANCVWLDYAEKLCDYYKDGGEAAVKEINERISDSNIKAYLLHEIRMRNKK